MGCTEPTFQITKKEDANVVADYIAECAFAEKMVS